MQLPTLTGQPQGQLAIFADVAINEVLQHRGHVAPFKAEAAQYFLRHGVRHVFGAVGVGVEHHHAQRVAVLAAHQIGDGGLKISATKIGLCERRAKPAIVVDDDVVILGRTRNNRGPFTWRACLPARAGPSDVRS